VDPVDDFSFRRSAWWQHSVNEAQHLSENVGILDMTAFAKSRISGPGAEAFLDNLLANKISKKIGRVSLCHALNTRGGVHSEFTVIRESDDSFYCVSAGALARLDQDWVKKHLPDDRSVTFQDITNQYGVLVIAGPKSRDLMEKVSSTDFSNKAFPWLTSQQINVNFAPALAVRVNYIGELGWELHHPMEYQNHIFDALMAAGKDLDIKPFGIRAMDMLRIEKSYRMVGTEMSIEYSAYESALDRFIHPDKGDFIGRGALLAWQNKGFDNAFATLEVHDITDADPLGSNPLYHDGKVVGRATSGNYGPRLRKTIALAMIKPALAAIGTELEIEILGTMHRATVIEESPFDPRNERLRS
jgi:dimethylglycine dehydrogenase